MRVHGYGALALAAAGALACGAGGGATPTGEVRLGTSISAESAGAQVKSVYVEVLGVHGNSWPGFAGDLGAANQDPTVPSSPWAAHLGQIPVGDVSVYARALDAGGGVVFESDPTDRPVVAVGANEVLDVTLVLQEKAAALPYDNHPPYVLAIIASAIDVDTATTVHLAALYGDPDGPGDVRAVAWSGPGTFTSATKAATDWTPPAAEGDYTLRFTVTDSKGQRATCQITIHVKRASGKGGLSLAVDLNNFPVVRQMLASRRGVVNGVVLPGDLVALSAVARDADGDAVSYAWQETNGCGGAFVGGTSGASVSYQTGPGAASCVFVVTVKDFVATDPTRARGGSNTGTLRVEVQRPVVGVGPDFFVSFATPTTLARGQQAEAQIVPSDRQPHFAGSPAGEWRITWSDGGAGGAFSYPSPSYATRDHAMYTPPAACPAGFAGGRYPLPLTVTAVDAATGATSAISIELELACP